MNAVPARWRDAGTGHLVSRRFTPHGGDRAEQPCGIIHIHSNDLGADSVSLQITARYCAPNGVSGDIEMGRAILYGYGIGWKIPKHLSALSGSGSGIAKPEQLVKAARVSVDSG